jgi:hypothetical protein
MARAVELRLDLTLNQCLVLTAAVTLEKLADNEIIEAPLKRQ